MIWSAHHDLTYPDFARTAVALAHWEAFEAAAWWLDDAIDTNAKVLQKVREDNTLRMAVGLAFYEDTKDRNNPSCAGSVANDMSYVRKCVREWKARGGS